MGIQNGKMRLLRPVKLSMKMKHFYNTTNKLTNCPKTTKLVVQCLLVSNLVAV